MDWNRLLQKPGECWRMTDAEQCKKALLAGLALVLFVIAGVVIARGLTGGGGGDPTAQVSEKALNINAAVVAELAEKSGDETSPDDTEDQPPPEPRDARRGIPPPDRD